MAVKIERTNYKTKHFAALAAAMRQDDRREALAMLGMGGGPALFLSMYCSKEMYVVTNEADVPLCAFGVCSANGVNLIWFIASQEIEKHKRDLLQQAKGELDKLVDKYGRLENLVDIRSKKSLRFIRWLGFTFMPEVVGAGVNGELFYHFYKERGEADCVL